MLQLIIAYLPSLLCGLHVVRTGRLQPWLWILVIAPVLGPLIYLFAVLIPEWTQGPTARRVTQVAVKVLDPEKEYRAAAAQLADTPSVQNNVRVGHAAMSLGRFEEAEARYREATAGSHADDPDLIARHAQALVELGNHKAALERLEAVRALDAKMIERGDVALLFARALEGLGRFDEAEPPYRWAADRVPGLEAASRYAAFLAKTGKAEEARLAVNEIERRFAKIAPALRPAAKPWRDMAAEALRTAG
jgi:hypothetical protein